MYMLKTYHKDTKEPSQCESERALMGVQAEFDCQAKQIIFKCGIHLPNNRRCKDYLVYWKGLSDSETSWELV